MRPDYGPRLAGLDEETRLEALDVLSELLDWSRSDQGWAQVEEAVAQLAASVAAGDAKATREALFRLDELSPVRTRRVGDPPTAGPPPRSLIERVTVLQYAVRADSSATRRAERPAGAEPPDDRGGR